MNLLIICNNERAVTKEKLYIVQQNGFDLTDGMSEYSAEMWIVHHQHIYANLEVREVRYG